MARIYPFRGFRYAPERVGDLAKVVTQPYDKIPEELRREYLQRSPYNIVRVIKNPDYREAAEFLRHWISDGVLRQDEKPALYLYEQQFSFEGEPLIRRGIIGLLALDDPDSVVHGHETVLESPLQDRLALIRQTEANEGLVFTLFSDPTRRFDTVLEEISREGAPVAVVEDDFHVINRLWRMTDPDQIAAVSAALAGSPLYIADGHHRFQTSVLFYRECLARGWKPAASESFDKRMVAVFNMESEGMRILPTHRGVRDLPAWSAAAFLRELQRYFTVESASLAEVWERVAEGRHVFGFCWRDGSDVPAVAARLRPEALTAGRLSDVAEPLRELDVTILHELVLHEILGVDPEAVTAGKHVRYYRERELLVDAVSRGELQLGCLLRPTALAEVRRVAEAGFRMPQKSTDFYPKLLTGLVLMKMAIRRSGT
ncbi:MAG: DUF1015 domain-containing protein [Acidobacteriota bacterium]